MKHASPVMLAVLIAAGAALLLTTPVDYSWTVYLATHKVESFAEYMGQSIFEGELPGGGDPVICYLIAVVGFYYATLRAKSGSRLYLLRPAAGFLVVASLTSAIFTVHSLKWIVGRARPGEVFSGHLPFSPWFALGPQLMSQGIFGGSFPSGHTALAFTPFALVYVLARRWSAGRNALLPVTVGALVMLYTAAMGTARCMTSSHWVSDVAGSVALSMAAMYLIYFKLLQVPAQEAAAGRGESERPLPIGWELRLAFSMSLFCAGAVAALCGLRIIWRQGLDGWSLMVPVGAVLLWIGVRQIICRCRQVQRLVTP
ncbi:MAG: phosphatase PAP2 family protein [Pseudomonadota bacterium]